MGNYEILFKKSVEKDIKSIPRADLQLIFQRIEDLRSNPRPAGCEKLTRYGFYRIRQGAYRIIYHIEDNQLIITVIKVGHRKDVYRLT